MALVNDEPTQPVEPIPPGARLRAGRGRRTLMVMAGVLVSLVRAAQELREIILEIRPEPGGLPQSTGTP